MKKAYIMFLCVLIIGAGGILVAYSAHTAPKPDAARINDAVITALQKSEPNEAVTLLTQTLTDEIHRTDAQRRGRDTGLQVFLFIVIALLAAAGTGLYLYCERRILFPFRKLQGFARAVAAGNLDLPLRMDKGGVFGAFTESFDLMREQLKTARENERNADQSKKELVASLSHDIKTPVASIKAATEFMLVTQRDEKDRRQLIRIGEKAEQINTLVTNLFSATLEELQQLSVTVKEIQSTEISRLILRADDKGRIQPFVIPDCIVRCDTVRLQQVFDNIIGNSYKYADSDMTVDSQIDGYNLNITIRDFGPGVAKDELPLIAGKYYRGKNAADKSGYGLGLFIAKTLLTQMSGSLRCENRPGGFAVILSLRLA